MGLSACGIVLLLGSCGGDASDDGSASAEPVIVAAADDTVRLAIPPGALPEGVEPGDLSVESVAMVTLQDVVDGNAVEQTGPVLAVDLQPDGLKFEQPIKATLQVPRGVMNGPLAVFHVSDDGVEALELELTSDNPDFDFIEATVELESFSDLMGVTMWISQTDLFTVTQSVDRTEVPVKQTFAASASITRLSRNRVVSGKLWVPTGRDDEGDIIGEVRDVDYALLHTSVDWRLKGTLKVMEPAPSLSQSTKVSPWDANAPTWETFTKMESNLYESGPTTRTCDAAGPWDVYYQAFAMSHYSAEPTVQGLGLPSIPDGYHGKNINVFREQGSVPGECVDGSDSGDGGSGVQIDQPPAVEPISATVALPQTTYSVTALDPDGDTLSYVWSGNNCGTITGETSATMVWTHDDDVCPHTTADHADATIVVVVTARDWEVTCRYLGAAAGVGSACEDPVAK